MHKQTDNLLFFHLLSDGVPSASLAHPKFSRRDQLTNAPPFQTAHQNQTMKLNNAANAESRKDGRSKDQHLKGTSKKPTMTGGSHWKRKQQGTTLILLGSCIGASHSLAFLPTTDFNVGGTPGHFSSSMREFLQGTQYTTTMSGCFLGAFAEELLTAALCSCMTRQLQYLQLDNTGTLQNL